MRVRQDSNGRVLRVGCRVRDAFDKIDGTLVSLSEMAVIVDDSGKRYLTNYDDITCMRA